MKNDTEKPFTPEQSAQAWAFLYAIARGENPKKPDFFPDADREADQEVDRRERRMVRATMSLEQHIRDRRALRLVINPASARTAASFRADRDDRAAAGKEEDPERMVFPDDLDLERC
ncbi:hypothetical protein [Acidithiobacillus sp.]|uniref:hypothetical protein n=1 Tax=Acidithiobacillus sp. TaxID=1872118 RepID=UPI002323CACA|nr:hypothetical protein [Acidithiobacillus sp.]MDA8246962.1 hypothetical protein [Acidithiobacillus sp.]